jgi:sodium-coupled neutral amino acid transporter 11
MSRPDSSLKQLLLNPDADKPEASPQFVSSARLYLSSKFTAGSLKGSMFTIFAATTGAGILTLPYALSLAGLYLGAFLFVLGYLVCSFTCSALIQGAFQTKARSFSDLGEICYGKSMRVFIELNLIFNVFGTAVAYLVLIKTLIPQVLVCFEVESEFLRSEWLWGIGLTVSPRQTCIVYPLSLSKHISVLRYLSVLSFVAVFYLAALVTFQFFHLRPDQFLLRVAEAPKVSLSSAASVIPLVLFAYSCQPNVLMIFDELQRPSVARGRKFLMRGLGIVLVLYLLVGIFGFLTFYPEYTGQHFPGQILTAAYNPEDSSVIIALLSVSVCVITGTPLCFYPLREALYSLLWPDCHISNSKHFVVTSAAVVSALLIALAVPGITSVMTVIGSISNPTVRLSQLCILPLTFYIKLSSSSWLSTDLLVCRLLIVLLAVAGLSGLMTLGN